MAVLVCLQLVMAGSAACDSVDVFPLVKGLQQSYLYHGSRYVWQFSSEVVTTDSGMVELVVRDSTTLDDTTIVWTVVEKRAITRRTVTNLPPADTTFYVTDSMLITLYECVHGYHRLKCTSETWEFPASFYGGYEYPIYRYSDSAHAMLAFESSCPRFPNADYDTLWFSNDSGLVKREYSRCFSFDEYGETIWRSLTLLSQFIVSVEVVNPNPLPVELKLAGNYPNPFNPVTTIEYYLPKSSETDLAVYDVLGHQVANLIGGFQQSGFHHCKFDGSGFGSGVYFVRLYAGGIVRTRKMVLLK